MNVAQLLRHWALADCERTALVTFEGDARSTVSYGTLDLRARTAAAALAERGVGGGSHVALTLDSGLPFLDAFFGCLYLGATVLPIPPRSSAPELRYRLERARCSALIHDEANASLAATATSALKGVSGIDAAELQSAQPRHEGPVPLSPAATAMMLFTSGTTGSPKAAMISHASLFTHTGALVHHVLQLDRDDVVMAALPLSHSYGIRMALLAPFYAGARVVLLERFSAQRVLALLDVEGISWLPAVPTMFHALAHRGSARPPRAGRLRSCLSAGAPLPEEIRQKAELALGAPVRQGYGMTEATFTAIARRDEPAGEHNVGRPVFGVEIRIEDEKGNALGPGERGEICVRGQNVMLGYFEDDEASDEVLRNGYMHSGDVGYLDERGVLHVVDRIKDMIIRGGFNVYPAEVEAVLVAHPAVHDAVVVGVVDSHYGEEVVALIVPEANQSLTGAELSSYCQAQLSDTKRPRLWGTVDAMPVGPSGKVLRRELRELARRGEIALTPLP